jgi:deoxyribonuclease-4
VVAHASYLINLAATDEAVLKRSRAALADELQRCAELGVDGLVLHPGAHLGTGVEAGVERVVASITAVLDGLGPLGEPGGDGPRLLLENTAGQGTVLGSRLEELAAMLGGSDRGARLGVCIDSCHAFAAGYPVHEAAGLDDFFAAFDRQLGAAALACVHLNDSQKPFASHRDRHANLGDGEMGAEAFGHWVAHPRLAGVPLIIETPHGDDEAGYRADLALLRGLRAEAVP